MSRMLDLKIAEREERVSGLERELMILRAELAAYVDARSIIMTEDTASSGLASSDDDAERRGRRPPPGWQKTMQTMANKYPKPFSIDDVLAAAKAHQFYPTRGNVRSQMHAYYSKDQITRVSDGIFSLTQKGINDLDLITPEPPAALRVDDEEDPFDLARRYEAEEEVNGRDEEDHDDL